MTTKKSKPASLTSALLARKGEAGPASDSSPLSEPVRMSGPRSGNGNGSGAGAGLGNGQDENVFRRLGGTVRSERPYVPAPQAEPEETMANPDRSAHLQAQMTSRPGQHSETAMDEPSATPQPSDRIASAENAPDNDERDAELRRESARDARLLRFVYGMAALTGILAIILYAGGWLIERQDVATVDPGVGETAQERLASAPSSEAPAPALPPSSPIAMPEPIVIPPAPPATRESAVPSEQRAPAAEAESASSSDATGGASPSAVPSGPVASVPLETSAGRETPLAGEKPAGIDTPPSPPSITAPRSATDQPAPPPASSPVESRSEAAMPKPSPTAVSPPAADQPAAGGRADTGGAASPRTPDTSVAARTPPSKPAPVTSPGAPGFYVQLSSLRSEENAQREWQRLQKAFPESLGERSLLIERREIADRGTFFRVQTGGFASMTEAQDFCASLQAQNQPCLAIRK